MDKKVYCVYLFFYRQKKAWGRATGEGRSDVGSSGSPATKRLTRTPPPLTPSPPPPPAHKHIPLLILSDISTVCMNEDGGQKTKKKKKNIFF